MTIDTSGEWWKGSEPADIEGFLKAFTESTGSYPVSSFRSIDCQCGSDRFRLQRSGDIVKRECPVCGIVSFTCRSLPDWEEAIEEEQPEQFTCVECESEHANVGIGFAGYPEAPELDALKWFYVGVRCATCGILGCFCDGKIGWGPAEDVYRQA